MHKLSFLTYLIYFIIYHGLLIIRKYYTVFIISQLNMFYSLYSCINEFILLWNSIKCMFMYGKNYLRSTFSIVPETLTYNNMTVAKNKGKNNCHYSVTTDLPFSYTVNMILLKDTFTFLFSCSHAFLYIFDFFR